MQNGQQKEPVTGVSPAPSEMPAVLTCGQTHCRNPTSLRSWRFETDQVGSANADDHAVRHGLAIRFLRWLPAGLGLQRRGA